MMPMLMSEMPLSISLHYLSSHPPSSTQAPGSMASYVPRPASNYRLPELAKKAALEELAMGQSLGLARHWARSLEWNGPRADWAATHDRY